jgi:hypothetical protein
MCYSLSSGGCVFVMTEVLLHCAVLKYDTSDRPAHPSLCPHVSGPTTPVTISVVLGFFFDMDISNSHAAVQNEQADRFAAEALKLRQVFGLE